MLDKILVDRETVFRLPQRYPFRFHIQNAVTLLQEQDISRDLRSCVRAKSGVRQANRAQQVGALGKEAPDGAVLLIHRVARGYESHYTARTHKIKGFRKEIVVNMKVMPVIFRIVDLV